MSTGTGEGDDLWAAEAGDHPPSFIGNILPHSRAQFGGSSPPGALGAEPLASEDASLGGCSEEENLSGAPEAREPQSRV